MYGFGRQTDIGLSRCAGPDLNRGCTVAKLNAVIAGRPGDGPISAGRQADYLILARFITTIAIGGAVSASNQDATGAALKALNCGSRR